MNFQPDWIDKAALFALPPIWVIFGVIFFLGRGNAAPKAMTVALSGKSMYGFVLQMVAYAVVFAIQRPRFSPVVPSSRAADAAVQILATAVGLASIWLCLASARTLGKQWSLVARVVRQHELIQRGPYAIVRHPIYLAMLGLLVQAGIVVAQWQALLPAVVAFLVGTQIRVREEEKILIENFGAEYEEYSHRVPAFIPRVFGSR
jgi:protein-S-isoprenylcysteine O-methyltransferase Ste14